MRTGVNFGGELLYIYIYIYIQIKGHSSLKQIPIYIYIYKFYSFSFEENYSGRHTICGSRLEFVEVLSCPD